jgi:hypothetical protein
MATIKQLQKQLDDRTLVPSELTRKQREIIDTLIERGDLKGPTTGMIQAERDKVASDIAGERTFTNNPLKAGTGVGQPTFELVGDVAGSIYPYVAMRKQIFGAAKSGNLWQKGPGKLLQSATKVADRLPGRFKLFGGALKLLARVGDVPGKVLQSPLGKAEVYSVLGGTAGAGAGAVTYDLLNETAGTQIASALGDDLSEIPPGEVDRNTLTNAGVAMKNALYWNAGAAALTPFIFGPLGKLGRKLFGTVGKEQKELAQFARDKGLPVPLLSAMKQDVGPLGNIGKTYFKTVGVFPFVSAIGRDALQGAEQAAGKVFLNDVTTYAPLMKTSVLSSSVYKQVNKVFQDNVDLIASKYGAFDALSDAVGNPSIIKLKKSQAASREFLERFKAEYPGFTQYDRLVGDIPLKDIDKILTQGSDPINTFMKAMVSIGDNAISPKQYKGVMTMLNRAIEGTGYQTLKREMFVMREALENDFAAFGSNINKAALLGDEGIKATYDTIAKQSGNDLAEQYINKSIQGAEKLRDKLLDANKTYSSILGFYQRAKVPQIIKKFDRSAFTSQSLQGFYGKEAVFRDQLFETLERDVFQSNSPKALEQFSKLVGAEGSAELGIKATEGGKALLKAAKARYLFNTFLDSFDSATAPQAQSIFKNVADEMLPGQYMQDSMEILTRQGREDLGDFSISKVMKNNGIYDVKDIRFSPNDFAQFNINKFLNKLGIGEATEELGRSKMTQMLGKDGANEFFGFTNYMKAISDVPLSDTSTFLQRRLTLSGGRGIIGGLVMGGSFMANPLAPAVLILLARRAGQILSDPVALRYMNDALLPEEQIKLLRGGKLGRGTPRALFPGRDYFTGRDINVGTKALTRLGLTQKREAFARLLNYLNEEDKDIPTVDADDINQEDITNRLLSLDYSVPQPRYDDKTLPKETVESMFVQQFTNTSGNVDLDNEMASVIRGTVQNEEATLVDEVARDEDADRQAVTGDLELQPVNQAPQTPVTGQQTAQQIQTLFPFDTTSAAIAQRRERG